MKTSIQNSIVNKRVAAEKALELLSEAGFEAVDFSVTGNMIPWEEGPFTDPTAPEFREYFRKIRAAADRQGLELYQTHAPYCRPFQCDPDLYAALQKQIIRSVYATADMDCRYIVAHPILYPEFNNGARREEAIRTNLEFFGQLAPVLKETGVVMCIENLYWGLVGKAKVSNACSDAGQLIEVIDTLNGIHGPLFAACLDTGHAICAGHDPVAMLRALGGRTRALHLHESWGLLDDHLFPATTGDLDWNEFCRVLGETGYEGTLNFEAILYPQNAYTDEAAYEAFRDAALKMLSGVARSLAKIAEGAWR